MLLLLEGGWSSSSVLMLLHGRCSSSLKVLGALAIGKSPRRNAGRRKHAPGRGRSPASPHTLLRRGASHAEWSLRVLRSTPPVVEGGITVVAHGAPTLYGPSLSPSPSLLLSSPLSPRLSLLSRDKGPEGAATDLDLGRVDCRRGLHSATIQRMEKPVVTTPIPGPSGRLDPHEVRLPIPGVCPKLPSSPSIPN